MGARAPERERSREHREQPGGAGGEGDHRGAAADQRVAEELVDGSGHRELFRRG